MCSVESSGVCRRLKISGEIRRPRFYALLVLHGRRFVHIDCDLYSSRALNVITLLAPRITISD